MRSRSEVVMRVAREIVRLEEQLERKRAEFDRLVSVEQSQLALPLRATESYVTRVQTLLEASDEPLGFEQIARMVEGNRESVRATISKLVGAKKIQRVGPQLYRARESSTSKEKTGT